MPVKSSRRRKIERRIIDAFIRLYGQNYMKPRAVLLTPRDMDDLLRTWPKEPSRKSIDDVPLRQGKHSNIWTTNGLRVRI